MVKAENNPSGWEIDYLGWSGFHIHKEDAPDIFIDPPKGTPFPENEDVTIFITHGHPEHLGGTLDLIKAKDGANNIMIIASEKIGTYLTKECQRKKVNFLRVAPGQNLTVATDIEIDVFGWQHMPLLPPGFGAGLRHIWHLLKGYRQAWQIIKMSLYGPKTAGKMLGFILRFPGYKNIIIYGEGLHRKCHIEEVSSIGQLALGSTLLVAAEPEDFDQLPELILASGAAEAILYEPHREWRDLFSLPHMDLRALQRSVTSKGVSAIVPEYSGKEKSHE